MRPKQKLTWGFSFKYDDAHLNRARFQNESAIHLVEEEDGVRMIGRDTVEFFRRVPGESLYKARHWFITCKSPQVLCTLGPNLTCNYGATGADAGFFLKTLFSNRNIPESAWKISLENTIKMVLIIPSVRDSKAQTFRNCNHLEISNKKQWKQLALINE